jgi:hypothetical protein
VWSYDFLGAMTHDGRTVLLFQTRTREKSAQSRRLVRSWLKLLNWGISAAFMGVNGAVFVRYFVREQQKNWVNLFVPVLGFCLSRPFSRTW